MARGLLTVVSGPSGVGKDSLLRRVFTLDPTLLYSVSYTTRQPRVGEVDGVDYHFVSEDEFDRLIEEGQMLEWANVHGHRSGTGRAHLETALAEGRPVVLNVDVQGGMSVRRAMPDAFLIFLTPPTRQELWRRLADRGTEDPAEIARRQADAEIEMGYSDRYDAVVVNADLDRAAQEVLDLIHERRARAKT
jgi:guanylate kinase